MATQPQGPQPAVLASAHMEKDGFDLMSDDLRNQLRIAQDERGAMEVNITELREALGIRPCVHCSVSIAVGYRKTNNGFAPFALEHNGKLHPNPCKAKKGVA